MIKLYFEQLVIDKILQWYMTGANSSMATELRKMKQPPCFCDSTHYMFGVEFGTQNMETQLKDA